MNKELLSVTYNTQIPLVAISPSVWTMVGPVQWFDNYHIISSVDNPIAKLLHAVDIRPYATSKDDSTFPSVKSIYGSDALQLLEKDCGYTDYYHVMNRASNTNGGVHNALTNDIKVVSQFENKALFRKMFAEKLPFAPFELQAIAQLELEGFYTVLSLRLGERIVIQHPRLAGGRGSFIISNQDEYDEAITYMKTTDLDFTNEHVVISSYLSNASERSLQGCVTNDDVLVGPPQAQLVRNSLLVSSNPGDIQFCGGMVHNDLFSQAHYEQASSIMKIIGKALRSRGYRGIFGVDFLVVNDVLTVLEVNPRKTGLTPLLAFLQKSVPFQLIHILELAHEEYALSSNSEDSITEEGSFIQVYAQNDGSLDLTTGVYDKQLNWISSGFEQGSMIPEDPAHYFIGMRVNPNQRVEVGKSLAFVYSKSLLFDENGELSSDARILIKNVRLQFQSS